MDPSNLERNSLSESSDESSSETTSYSITDPKKTVKKCCRRIVTFMCTQVGVGGLIVGYAVVGAFGFQLIEGSYSDPQSDNVTMHTNETLEKLWNITDKFNVLENKSWSGEAQKVLEKYQVQIVESVRLGHTNVAKESLWNFPAALMFCLSVFTMIGYGNMVPHTTPGRVATIVYAVFGIPLYILYFQNMGKVLAQTFRWTYTWIYRCSMEDSHPRLYNKNNEVYQKRVIVPSTACLWVLFAYVATGTAMFSSWQKWDVLDSVYFCVTSLCKIGIGDFAPENMLSPGGDPTRLVFTFVYLLFGMGIIAMCFDLMKEDVTVRVRKLKNDVVLCFEDIQSRAVEFYRRRNSLE